MKTSFVADETISTAPTSDDLDGPDATIIDSLQQRRRFTNK